MDPQAIIDLIQNGIPGAQATCTGDGSHFDATVISDAFEGKNTLARQRLVFGALGDAITSGRLHNLNLRTLTRAEAGQAG